jgi:hypothetical protein
MKEYFVAAVLIAVLAAPALGEQTYFIMYDNTRTTCTIMTEIPADKERYK